MDSFVTKFKVSYDGCIVTIIGREKNKFLVKMFWSHFRFGAQLDQCNSGMYRILGLV